MLSSQLQEESHGEVPRILQHYTAEKLSSFGELALMWVLSLTVAPYIDHMLLILILFNEFGVCIMYVQV